VNQTNRSVCIASKPAPTTSPPQDAYPQKIPGTKKPPFQAAFL
jgi:hypothetical protein